MNFNEHRERFAGKVVVAETGCWNWAGSLNAGGYGQFSAHKRNHLAHRVSWVLHFAPLVKSDKVCHRCDNRRCVNPEHLFVGTQADNNRDMREKGRARAVSGAQHPRARLSDDDVAAIRSSSLTNAELAARHGVNHRSIHNIRKGVSWKSAPGPLKAKPGRPNLDEQCPHGHQRTTENTRIKPNGVRVCRVCAAERERNRRVREPARIHAGNWSQKEKHMGDKKKPYPMPGKTGKGGGRKKGC